VNLTKAGYAVGRISVNVSALELKDDAFCSDINRVIREAGISSSKIAIELTESRTEDDFLLAREKMEQLRSNGIRLYLDDFGTGYTNLERIVEIPFDIIKFDRSMVVASSSDEKAGQLLESLAAVFAEMGYAVLFEGVENESDEKRCRNMSATYLQGYKYSRPVPIERLNQFFPQAG
jgi:EAL domain-containing protein (putative c-di-GMP-specific phosphodiesterase class I)